MEHGDIYMVTFCILEPPLHKIFKFFIKDFFSKCEQIRSFLRIWWHLLKKSSTENFIFYAVHSNSTHLISVTLSNINDVIILPSNYILFESMIPRNPASIIRW